MAEGKEEAEGEKHRVEGRGEKVQKWREGQNGVEQGLHGEKGERREEGQGERRKLERELGKRVEGWEKRG